MLKNGLLQACLKVFRSPTRGSVFNFELIKMKRNEESGFSVSVAVNQALPRTCGWWPGWTWGIARQALKQTYDLGLGSCGRGTRRLFLVTWWCGCHSKGSDRVPYCPLLRALVGGHSPAPEVFIIFAQLLTCNFDEINWAGILQYVKRKCLKFIETLEGT